MNAPVIYLPDAATDVERACFAYDQRQSGLSDRFLEQLRHRVEMISDNPELYAVLANGIRAAPVGRFPFVVYYRFEVGTVYIIAILHGHQNPQTWKNRG